MPIEPEDQPEVVGVEPHQPPVRHITIDDVPGVPADDPVARTVARAMVDAWNADVDRGMFWGEIRAWLDAETHYQEGHAP